MSSVSEWLDLMQQEVILQPRGTLDKWGKASVNSAAAKTVRCRIQRTNFVMRDVNGVEKVIAAKVYLGDPEVGVATDDLITLDDGVQVEVAAVSPVFDEAGLHHRVLMAAVPK